MIPLPHKVKVYKTGTVDEWGIISPAETFNEYAAFVQYSSQMLLAESGKEIKIDLNITFKGDKDIEYADFIEFKNIKKNPASIEKIFDLSGTVLYVKVLL